MEHFCGKKEIKIEPEEIIEFSQLEDCQQTPFEIIPFEPAQNIPLVPEWLIPVDYRETKIKKEKIEENVPLRKPVVAANASCSINNAVKVSSRDPRLKGAPAPPAPRMPAIEKIIKVNQPFPISSHASLALPANKIQKVTTKDVQTQTTPNTGTLYLELSDVKLRRLTKSQKDILIKFKKVSLKDVIIAYVWLISLILLTGI